MGETDLSRSGAKMLKDKFPCIRSTRLQCGTIFLKGRVMRLSDVGWPDRIGYLPDGRFFAIEWAGYRELC